MKKIYMVVLLQDCAYAEDYGEYLMCVVEDRKDADLFMASFPADDGWKYDVREAELLTHDDLLHTAFETPTWGCSACPERTIESMDGRYYPSL